MSPLPKRKKTPEELAKLRESLGISPEGPPSGAPGSAAVSRDPESTPETEPVPDPKPVKRSQAIPVGKAKPITRPEPITEPEPIRKAEPQGEEPVVLGKSEESEAERAEKESPKPRPVRSLRKSERLPVDKPKKVVSRDSGELPTRRHTDEELARLRHQPPADAGPSSAMQQLGVAWPILAAIYGLGTILILTAGAGALSERAARIDLPFDWLRDAVVREGFRTILFGFMAGGAAVLLLGAGWIYFKRPLASHHSAIMTIIAVLVLVFGTLYLFPGLHGA